MFRGPICVRVRSPTDPQVLGVVALAAMDIVASEARQRTVKDRNPS